MMKLFAVIYLSAVSQALSKAHADSYGSWEKYTLSQPANLLPGTHARAEKALRGSAAGVVAHVVGKEIAAKQARGKLIGAVEDTQQHESDAAKIKHSIAEKQAQLREARRKHDVVKDNVEQLERTHTHLVNSVHKTLDPKLDQARAHLKRKQTVLSGETDALEYWTNQERRISEDTAEAIKQEQDAHHALAELQGQVAWKKQQEETAESKYRYSSSMAKEEQQSLQYAQERYESETSRLSKAKQDEAAVAKKIGDQDDIHAMQELEDARREVRSKQDDADDWKDNFDHVREEAKEMEKQNQTAFNNLKESQTQLEWTEQSEKFIEKQYELKRELAAQEAAALKNAGAQLAVEVSKTSAAKEAAKAAEQSVQRLQAIRTNEVEQVENTIADGKGKLKNKLREWDASHEKTAHDIDSLEKQYANWQDSQERRVQELSSLKDATEDASEAYESSVHEALARGEEEIFEEDHRLQQLD